MKIAVIISNYNYEKYLEESIKSVLRQTYQDYKLYIVDDGSTDNSVKIIDLYEKKYPDKIKAIYKENGGQGSAFNEAMHYIDYECEIIAFLDADDYWFPNKLSQIIQSHHHYDIVEHSLETTLNTCMYRYPKVNAQKRLLKTRKFESFVPTSGLSYKKTILQKIFPIPEDITNICADTYINLVAIYHGARIKTLNQALGMYRIHDTNNWISNPQKYAHKFESFVNYLNDINSANNLPLIPNFKQAVHNTLKEHFGLEKKKFIIYGAGNFSEVVSAEILSNYGEVVFYVVTNNEKKINSFLNRSIYSLEEVINRDLSNNGDVLVIANSFKNEVLIQLRKLNVDIPTIVFDI